MSVKYTEEQAKQKAEEKFRDLIRMIDSFETTMGKMSAAMLKQDFPEAMKYVKELKEKTINEQNKKRTSK